MSIDKLIDELNAEHAELKKAFDYIKSKTEGVISAVDLSDLHAIEARLDNKHKRKIKLLDAANK